MFSKIIVGYDARDGGRDALALGTTLARVSDAQLVVAGVIPIGSAPWSIGLAIDDLTTELRAEIEPVAETAAADCDVVVDTSAARGLLNIAERQDADLIVIGTSHRGRAGRVIEGDVALGLLHGSPCAVAIAPPGYREHDGGVETIVVGVDGSPESKLALADAAELARAASAELKLVAASEPPPVVYGKGGWRTGSWGELEEAVREVVQERLTEARAALPDDMEAETSLTQGRAAEVLTDAAAAKGSLLVLGSRGYGPVRRVLLGSVSAALVRHAPCPILIHPRAAAEHGGMGEDERASQPAGAQ